jgi:hypothetical protein
VVNRTILCAAAIAAASLSTACAGDDTGSEPLPDPGGSCQGATGKGFAVGNIARNWALPDRTLQTVELFDFCGKVIFFEEGSQW